VRRSDHPLYGSISGRHGRAVKSATDARGQYHVAAEPPDLDDSHILQHAHHASHGIARRHYCTAVQFLLLTHETCPLVEASGIFSFFRTRNRLYRKRFILHANCARTGFEATSNRGYRALKLPSLKPGMAR